MRRNRSDEFVRTLVRESHLKTGDLVQPIFIMDGTNRSEAVDTMPGVSRLTIDLAIKKVATLLALKVPAIALFPVIDVGKKTHDGSEALNPDGIVQRAIRQIKKAAPKIGIISDVALDPFTSHGHDGILGNNGEILNDQTNNLLVKQALSLAQSGADILSPSDMMDGRIGRIRNALDAEGFENVKILSYAVKYASAFYGPFRDAVGSKNQLGKSDKKTYQMDPGNSDEALREVALDIEEGADMVMIKPGMPYLDVIHRIKTNFGVPTFAYQVSGEYLMLKRLCEVDSSPEKAVIIESLVAFKRAGADAIISYFSEKAAGWLLDSN